MLAGVALLSLGPQRSLPEKVLWLGEDPKKVGKEPCGSMGTY